MPPSLTAGQRQYNGYKFGPTCDVDIASEHGLDAQAPARDATTDIPGGGSYLGRSEDSAKNITLSLLPRQGLTDSALATLRSAVLAAFARSLDQPLYFCNPGNSTVYYLNAHVTLGPDWTWDPTAIAGLLFPIAVTLVASDPTVHTA